jgi:hypothetical protein
MITEEKAEEANQVIDLYEHDLDDSNIVTTSNIEDIYTDGPRLGGGPWALPMVT